MYKYGQSPLKCASTRCLPGQKVTLLSVEASFEAGSSSILQPLLGALFWKVHCASFGTVGHAE